MKHVFLTGLSFLLLVCCTDKMTSDSMDLNDQSQTLGPLTWTLGEVTATTATFSIKLDVDMMANYQEVGLILSQDDNLCVENLSAMKVRINKEKYEHTFTELLNNTDYYYTVYMLRNGVYIYGTEYSFKTKTVVIEVEDVLARYTDATFTGKFYLDEIDSGIEVGLAYSEDILFSSTTEVFVKDNAQNGNFSLSINGLAAGQKYYFRTFVKQNDLYEFGKTSSVTTNVLSIPVTLSLGTLGICTAKIVGKIDPLATYEGVEIAVLLGTSENVKIDNCLAKSTIIPDEISETGDFEATFSDLGYGRKYYYTCYVSSSPDPYSSTGNFESCGILLSVETSATGVILELNFNCGGLCGSQARLKELFWLLSSDPQPTIDNSIAKLSFITEFYEYSHFGYDFRYCINTGDLPDGKYYCGCYAEDINSNVYYGEIIEFDKVQDKINFVSNP